MEYLYKLVADDETLDGFFYFEKVFGFYFFTKETEAIINSKEVDLKLEGNKLTIIKGNSFKVYNTLNGYAFALAGNWCTDKVNYYDSNNVSEDIIDYLAAINHLPNGNYVVDSVQSYITAIEQISKQHPNKEAFYRGHYSYNYLLVPSLYRKKKYYDNESVMYMDFKTQFYKELSQKKYIEILTTMQHYSMPTRLLDTTSNPLVALYMACNSVANHQSKTKIGEVVLMYEDYLNVKYSDSNAITMLSCLAVLETPLKQELYEKIMESKEKNDPSIYRSCVAYKRFIAELKNELPCVEEPLFNPDTLLKPKHVKVGMINERIISQSGNFILFGLCNYETGEYFKLETVSNERIFIVHKEKINKQLLMLNINDGTMYPDKDHISASIVKYFNNK